MEDGTSGSKLGVHEPEAERYRTVAEQSLTGAENHGELPDAQGGYWRDGLRDATISATRRSWGSSDADRP